jgi:hypothetical protein
MAAMKHHYRIVLLLLGCLGCAAASGEQKYPYRLLLSDLLSQKLAILEKDGRVSWEYPEPGFVMDGQRLANGNLLYCWYSMTKDKQAGVKEITPDKQTVFEYQIAQECHSVQRLPDGLTLIEDPTNKRLIEVDRQGKIIRELKLQVGHDLAHRVARQCRKLPNGNYLVAQEFDQAVVEYAPDGKVLRRIPVKGMVFAVSRLANGNTLVGTGGGKDMGKSVVELDAKGGTVWSFEPSDFPPDTNLEWILGAQRLANGNTLIVNWLGHGKDGKGISLLEVTPQKQIVWTLSEKRTVCLVQILP